MSAQQVAQVDKLLSNVSNGLFLDEGYICEKLMPVIEVPETTGLMGKYGNGHLRIESSLMGGRMAAKRVEPITRTTDTYKLNHHGLEGIVTEEDYKNVSLPFKAEEDETRGVTSLLLQFKEYTLASALANTAVMTKNTTLSGQAQFSDFQNSSPLGVSQDAAASIKQYSGMVPNTVIMSWEVLNKLKYHPEILSNLGFAANRAGILSVQDIARALDVQRVEIAMSTYNSAKEGQADVLAPIWGKHMIFAYLPASAAPYQKSLGYYLRLQGVGSRRVSKYNLNNPVGAKAILVDDYFQYMIADANCGYLVKNVIA